MVGGGLFDSSKGPSDSTGYQPHIVWWSPCQWKAVLQSGTPAKMEGGILRDSGPAEQYQSCRVCYVRAPSVHPSEQSQRHDELGCYQASLPWEPCLKPQSKALQNMLHGQGHLDMNVLRGLAQHPLLQALGAAIRRGKCVAFPTETVYGLGANARDAEACRNIFALKRRPQSDPLICHVVSLEQALAQVVDLGGDDNECGRSGASDALTHRKKQERALCTVFSTLASAFWPGPLSLVARARMIHSSDSPHPVETSDENHATESPEFPAGVVEEVTAGTGMVAVRCPNHPLALALLLASGVPVAAPSANRFGKISPTSAEHVLKQFVDEATSRKFGAHGGAFNSHAAERLADDAAYDFALLDGGACCAVGIESTVVKLEAKPLVASIPEVEVTVLRRGCISPAMLHGALESAAIEMHQSFPKFCVRVSEKIDYVVQGQSRASFGCHGHCSARNDVADAARNISRAGQHTAMEAPGMCLTHYSPSVPTFLLSGTCEALLTLLTRSNESCPVHVSFGESREREAQLSSADCVLIDVDGSLASYAGSFLAYFWLASAKEVTAIVGGIPLDATRAAQAAARSVFGSLHAAEAAALRGTSQCREDPKEGSAERKQAWILLHAEPLLQWGEGGLAVYDRLFRCVASRLSNVGAFCLACML